LRISLKTTAGWLVPLAYLALPNCSFSNSVGSSQNLQPGPQPRNSVVFCDIERVLGRHCATASDLASGVPLSRAAVDLVRRNSSVIGLDYSSEALARCGGGPEAVRFQCPFPNGCPVCVKCIDAMGPSPAPYEDADAVCAAYCTDIFRPGFPEIPPDPLVAAFCAERSHASTNAPIDDCQGGACTPAGALRADYDDPRRRPEAVRWRDGVGVSTSGVFDNFLTKTGPGTGAFDSGAASIQAITRGDGYVEFTAGQPDTARACGLSLGDGGPDIDPTLAGIGFAVRLSPAGDVFIHENGVELVGGNPNGSFATYAANDRLRVSVSDNHDGTATVRYSLIPAMCGAGTLCPEVPLHTGGTASYPFRVDASLRTPGAMLDDVRVVRIK
jgi:hypothetical protein